MKTSTEKSGGIDSKTIAKNKATIARLQKEFEAAHRDEEREVELIPGVTFPLAEATLIAQIAQNDPENVSDDLQFNLAFYVRAVCLDGLNACKAVSTFRQLNACQP